MLAVKELLKPTVISSCEMDVWIKISTPKPLVIAGVYRQWSTVAEEEETLAKFHNRCSMYSSKYRRVILLGDFNLDPLRSDTGYSRLAMTNAHTRAMDAAGLPFLGPHKPTYKSYGVYGDSHRYSTLDHVYASGVVPSVDVLQYAATDHFPVTATVSIECLSTPTRIVLKRCLRNITETSMCHALDAKALSGVFAMEDVDEILHTITAAINQALDLIAPEKPTPVRPDKPPLFLAMDTKKIMKERDKAATTGPPDLFRALRNRATKLVRRDKLNSSRKCLDAAQGDPAKVWRLANKCLGSGPNSLPDTLHGESGPITGDSELAKTMNNFFIDKIKKIRDSICDTKHPVPLAGPAKFKLIAPSAGSVVRLISGLKLTPAVGTDNIPVIALKRGAQVLAAPIAHLLRVSMKKGVVPQAFKLACVSPIHKGKNKPPTSFGSYRPVAILPALSKILEAAVMRPFTKYLQDLLPNGQFGFRANRSASSAVAFAHGAWAKARAAGDTVAIAAFDMTAAFDTLDPSMVIGKLSALGVGGVELNWFASYMSGRKQCVRYNGTASPFIPVEYGVPQGSLLGPVLFLVLVSDMPKSIGLTGPSVSDKVGYVSYADDFIAWASDKRNNVAIEKLEAIAKSTSNYAAANWLALSKEKTQFMVIGSSSPSPLNIDGVTVLPTDELEVLGIRFDCGLKPDPYLRMQSGALSRICGVIRRLANHLPTRERATIAQALVRGKLGYGISTAVAPRLTKISHNNGRHTILQRNINNVARSVLGVSIADCITTEDLLQACGLPSVNRLAAYSIALECWKTLHIQDGPAGSSNPLGQLLGALPAEGLGPGHGACKATRATTAGHLRPPAKVAVNSFIWWAYSIWNSCPNLRQARNPYHARRAAAAFVEKLPL